MSASDGSQLLALGDRVLQTVGNRAEALVSVREGRSALTRFATSFIHQNVAEEVRTVTLQAVVDGRSASATTTQVDDDTEAFVARTIAAARLRPADPDWPGLAPPAEALPVDHHDQATREAEPDERARLVRAFVEASGGLEAAGFCATDGLTVAMANSAGLRLEGRTSQATLDGIARTRSSDGSARQTACRLAALDGGRLGALAAAKARGAADPVELEPGRYEVVLEPSCVANILLFLAYAGLNAKAVADGTSFAQLGEAQFDPAITLWDDAADPRTIGLGFDVEGTPKRRTNLVERGVTVGLAHDRRTAARAGTASTGHASGNEALGPYPANLFLGEGIGPPEDLVASVERGLLVSDFWYTRVLEPKSQLVTGLTRNGLFLLERGQVAGAVRNLRFTQSFLAALGPGQVKGVGNDGHLVGRTHVPSLHLASWNFSGGARG